MNRVNQASRASLKTAWREPSRVFAVGIASLAISQAVPAQVAAIKLPDFRAVDAKGVDLVSQTSNFSQMTVQIGSDERSLVHSIVSEANRWPMYAASRDTFTGFLYPTGFCPFDAEGGPYDAYEVNIAGDVVRFCLKNGLFVPTKRNGEELIDNGNGTHTFIQRDGTEYLLDSEITMWGYPSYSSTHFGTLTRIERPDGLTTNVHFRSATFNGQTWSRIQSVTQNNGYQIKYGYERNATPSGGVGHYEWVRPTSIRAINNAIDYCPPAADTCTYSQTWPTATIDYTFPATGILVLTVADPEGRSTTYTHESVGLGAFAVTRVKAPTSAGPDTTTYEYDDYTLCNQNGCQNLREDLVVGVTVDSAEWTYIPTQVPYHWHTERTGPTGRKFTVYFNSVNGFLEYIIRPDGSQGTFTNDSVNRLDHVTFPGSRTIEYTYDDRGNVTIERQIALSTASLPEIVRMANYDPFCSNPKTCNRPNWIKDGRGGQTDYEYYADSGLLKSVTGPPDEGGVRPQTRYQYTQLYAWFKDGTGSYVAAADPIWVLTEESYCRASAATAGGDCGVSGDEVVIAYEHGASGGANNLQLRGITRTSDGQTLRTCYGYDALGNRISATAPNAGLSACP